MSVLEFFTQYWDWYLLIGSVQALAQIFTTDKEDAPWYLWSIAFTIAGIGIILFWPIVIASGIRTYYQKKFENL